jgi:hypothetical protein
VTTLVVLLDLHDDMNVCSVNTGEQSGHAGCISGKAAPHAVELLLRLILTQFAADINTTAGCVLVQYWSVLFILCHKNISS